MHEKANLNIDHLKWAIAQRAAIQETLLELYGYLKAYNPDGKGWHPEEHFSDHLIAAGFSLWRAVFLADKPRPSEAVHAAQLKFLSTVLSTNAINFSDDRNNSEWSVTFYLENAKQRLESARAFAIEYMADKVDQNAIKHVELLYRIKADQVPGMRYEWEGIHAALRTLFKAFYPQMSLPIVPPNLIGAALPI